MLNWVQKIWFSILILSHFNFFCVNFYMKLRLVSVRWQCCLYVAAYKQSKEVVSHKYYSGKSRRSVATTVCKFNRCIVLLLILLPNFIRTPGISNSCTKQNLFDKMLLFKFPFLLNVDLLKRLKQYTKLHIE